MRSLLLSAAFAVLASCASTPSQNAGEPSATTAEVTPKVTSVRQSFPKEKAEQSAELLNIMRESGVPAVVMSGQQLVYRAYDVDCRTNDDGQRVCTFARLPDCKGKDCRSSIKRSRAESFADLLFGLPVAQGDSGAVTPFIACATSTIDTKYASCHVAILLDYQGP